MARPRRTIELRPLEGMALVHNKMKTLRRFDRMSGMSKREMQEMQALHTEICHLFAPLLAAARANAPRRYDPRADPASRATAQRQLQEAEHLAREIDGFDLYTLDCPFRRCWVNELADELEEQYLTESLALGEMLDLDDD